MSLPAGAMWFRPGPIIARSRASSDMAYFGTITIAFTRGRYNRLTTIPGQPELTIKDEADQAFAELVALNPGFSGREYFHLPGEMRVAPTTDRRRCP
jgi:hypothetical protein